MTQVLGSLDLSHSWLYKLVGCIKFIDSRVTSIRKDSTDSNLEGLFRKSPSEEVLSKLKTEVKQLDANNGTDSTLELLNDFVSKNDGGNDCTNAVASLLKWILREFPVPLLAFDYEIVEVQDKGYHTVTGESDKGSIGCKLAQDIILQMSTQLSGQFDTELIVHAISAVAQLLSMLCTVSRVESIRMPSKNLLIVFLPSLCNSRDPLKLMEESKSMGGLSVGSSSTDAIHEKIYRLQVQIMYGHRIWGYIEHSFPSLKLALDTIAELHDDSCPTEQPEVRHRKRDVLKRFMNKLRGKSDDKGKPVDAGTALQESLKEQKQCSNVKTTQGLTSSEVTYQKNLGDLAILTKSPQFGEEHVRRLAIERAESLSVTPSTEEVVQNETTTEEIRNDFEELNVGAK
mmetsp:Transcript_13887/g.15823  ORF Transcript_13887/g.15823 Transcript_13887/m.15823 type:complete len:400 (+) Transcript_13887:194-1393(+)